MQILIVDDDDTLRALLARELERSGHEIRQARSATEALASVADPEPDVVLLDLQLPDRPGLDVLRRLRTDRPGVEVVLLTAHGTVDTAIAAMKLGAFDYIQKPCHLQELELTLQRALERRRLGEENARLRAGLNPSEGVDLCGSGRAFDDLVRLIGKVARSDSTVLVQGETGTGKEMVARSIHRASARRDQPFVVVDCAALHDNLLQSELFGHEKGAFTGAVKLKYGLFEAAQGGSIVLDEIGDVSPAVQASLLRVLETSSFRRVGGTKEVRVDVRLIAATHRDLARMVRHGQFRQDLFFRLSTIRVEIPPLRERREEIPCLVEHFIRAHNERNSAAKRIPDETMDALRRYTWPGNVRELRHVIERASVLSEGEEIRIADLPPEVVRGAGGAGGPEDGTDALPLAEIEKRHILRVLARVGGHRERAAQLLGISERNLYRKLHELGAEAEPRAPGDREGEPR